MQSSGSVTGRQQEPAPSHAPRESGGCWCLPAGPTSPMMRLFCGRDLESRADGRDGPGQQGLVVPGLGSGPGHPGRSPLSLGLRPDVVQPCSVAPQGGRRTDPPQGSHQLLTCTSGAMLSAPTAGGHWLLLEPQLREALGVGSCGTPRARSFPWEGLRPRPRPSPQACSCAGPRTAVCEGGPAAPALRTRPCAWENSTGHWEVTLVIPAVA